MKILILGGGPAGLGAAWRLHELGHTDWELWEREPIPGGLSRSILDEHGFTWDIGGHVLFSHYDYFDKVVDTAVGADGWIEHGRESWLRMSERWVPYPLQYNIHRLPPEQTLACFKGLLEVAVNRRDADNDFANFEDMIRAQFGDGLAELFMLPYNRKVWAWPPSEMATGWIGERVAIPSIERVAESIVMRRDQVAWGPNNQFRFPREGGTGAIWSGVVRRLPGERIHFGRSVSAVDTEARVARADDRAEFHYDALISTIPVDSLIALARLDPLREAAAALRYSSTHVVGVGLRGAPAEEIASHCWMYFPEDNCPFYRVTHFSHYSPANVPDITEHWSLMAEIAESPVKPVDAARVVEDTIEGLLATGLIERREQIHHTWDLRVEHSYPTPSLGRDAALGRLLPALEAMQIYSRGRFGAWKYEVGNQDHSFMQGVEAVGRLLEGKPELTVFDPARVNAPRK